MRFKNGDKVEVMNTKEVPISWLPAEVLSAHGHTYSVQYDYHPGTARDHLVEMVPRRLMRPCPPPVQGVEIFNTGDIVEVFYRYSWKIAAILNILEAGKESKKTKTYVNVASFQNQYLVRLLGCSQELVVDRSIIRLRQTWRDNKWILMGKSSRAGDDVIASKPSTSNCCRKMQFQVRQVEAMVHNRSKKDCDNIHYDAAFMESPVISSRSLKRTSPYESSIIEPHNGRAQKRRATEEGSKQRVVADPVLEKGNGWRQVSIASNGLKMMMPGFAAFLLALNFRQFSLLQNRCYSLWPLPGITQFNLQYFSFFQDLLDVFNMFLLDESICKHHWTRLFMVPSKEHQFKYMLNLPFLIFVLRLMQKKKKLFLCSVDVNCANKLDQMYQFSYTWLTFIVISTVFYEAAIYSFCLSCIA